MPSSILDLEELYFVSKESIFLPHFHYRATASDGQNNLLIFHQELVELKTNTCAYHGMCKTSYFILCCGFANLLRII